MRYVRVHGPNSIRYKDGEKGKIYQVDFNGMDKVTKKDVEELGDDLEHPNLENPIFDKKITTEHKVVYFKLSKDRVIKITDSHIKVCEEYESKDLT
jgi:hypothetical protein